MGSMNFGLQYNHQFCSINSINIRFPISKIKYQKNGFESSTEIICIVVSYVSTKLLLFHKITCHRLCCVLYSDPFAFYHFSHFVHFCPDFFLYAGCKNELVIYN